MFRRFLQHAVGAGNWVRDAVLFSDDKRRQNRFRKSRSPNNLRLEPLERRELLTVTVLDDGAPGFTTTGTWDVAAQPGYDADFRGSISETGPGAATWEFDVTPGRYRVSATWVDNATYYANNSPFTIYDGTTPRGHLRHQPTESTERFR